MKVRAGFVLLLGVLVAADAKNNATKVGATKKPVDMVIIQGTWIIVAAEKNAIAFPKEELEHQRLTFMDDKVLFRVGESKIKGTFKLDTTKKPKTIKMKFKDGKEEGTLSGIYDLQGDGLKICAFQDEEEPPKEFKTAKGSPAVMMTLKREKK